MLTATSGGACRASTRGSSPSRPSSPTQMERSSARWASARRTSRRRWWAGAGRFGKHCQPGSLIFLSLLPSGSHSPANGRIHLLPGAGEDQASAAEHTAQALYPGSALPSPWLPLIDMGVSGPKHWLGTVMGLWVPSSPPTCLLLALAFLPRP